MEISVDLRKKLLDQLYIFEGLRLDSYLDSEGNPTIGIGHLLKPGESTSITLSEALDIFDRDIDEVIRSLNNSIPWWKYLTEIQIRILIDMTFNMGINRILGFRKFLIALHDGNNEIAAAEMTDSKWFRDLQRLGSQRAIILADWMKRGNDGEDILNA